MSRLTKKLHCVADFCVIPIGVGPSLSKYIVETQKILNEAGLTHKLHAKGTNIEGDWSEVMEAIRKCNVRLHELGVPRINTTIHVGTRTDKEDSIEAM
ncbi:6632_t:CDS:2 [Ambispora gerdemannii]|uniref:6632_t:CDS:1 n=1 Tax=Ambispora gerdemannii TaxID=144530 RepID=A0A9N9C5L7_9GLOM|nr:6632_t:CDS:2 [Ambispora gerdemannii]